MWNSGVIGLAPNHASLLEEAIQTCDCVYEATGAFNSEQYAVGVTLAMRLKICEAKDVVYHYCHPDLKRSLKQQFGSIYRNASARNLRALIEMAPAYRPKWGAYNRNRIIFKKALAGLGLWRKQIRFDLT
jgi:hypothetical protein